MNPLALELNAGCMLKKLGIKVVTITLCAVGNMHILHQAFQPLTACRVWSAFGSKGFILLYVASVLPCTA